MIEHIGIEGSREYHAATRLKAALLRLWPDLAETSPEEELVRIASDVKIAGSAVTDVDIVVSGYLKPGRYVQPRKVLRDADGKRMTGTPVAIENFVIAVEVKDQPARRVRIVGDKVEVYYTRGASRGWKDATKQNVDQAHAIKDYYGDAGQSPFVHRCLLMQGLDAIEADTAIAGDFSCTDFFTAVLAARPPRQRGGRYYLSSTTRQQADKLTEVRIFRPLVPTSLDRGRMDRLLQQGPVVDQLLAASGEKFTCLRGHGGTGKTVTFLQAAWKAYKERDARTLVLTYNHALAADIRRLLALLGIPSGEDGGIMVQTAMSFFYSWMHRLGVTMSDDEGYAAYPAKCREALDNLAGGALDDADLAAIKQSGPTRFDFDWIVVDEAQDWPPYEVALLKRLYDPRTIAVADGVDQLVRGDRADWLAETTRDTRQLVNLVHCLRMKRNLAVFAAALADEAGINLDILPSEKAGGGRVLLVEGPWSSQRHLHEELAAQAAAAKNEPIDSLYCVSTTSIIEDGDIRTSCLSRALAGWGLDTWDGVDDRQRQDFPRSTSEHRVVHYMSCRGLEGWTVVLEDLDQFWTERFELKQSEGLAPSEAEALHSLDDLAAKQAWRWAFIALTRPIDTLVITLSDLENPLSRVLLKVARDFPDIVENRITTD